METPQFVKSLNSWRTNEYNIDIATYVPKFHIPSKSLYSTSNSLNYDCKIVPGELINIDIETNQIDKFKKQLPPSAIEQNDSNEWIRKYGLSTHKLTLDQILSMIGFKHSEEYLGNVKKYITSKYSQGLFLQTISKNGTTYNITCNHVKLSDFIDRLKDSINLYKQRLQWLNTDSRRIFGVIVNYHVCLVLDVKQLDNKKFFHYCQSIIKLLREQVSKLHKFNIIRQTNQIESFKEKLIAVSNETIEEAIDWMNKWDFHSISITNTTSTCEASLLAFNFDQVDGVYLITESNSSNGSRELLFDVTTKESFKKKVPFHVVSFNCNDSSTVEFLHRLATSSYGPGRFHAYSLLKEIDHYDSGHIDRDPTKSQVIQHKRQFGGTPPGAGVRNDIILVFEQLQQATETVEHLNSILTAMTSRKVTNSSASSSAFFANSSSSIVSESTKSQTKIDEEALSSADWLKINGLGARKMELFDVLAHVAFRHCDGVVNIKQPPISGVGDAIPRDKIVNAKYCDTFAHVLWNDGTIRHVHVTPEIHRYYQSNIKMFLDQIERRIEWLSKGSRELFGTVIENNIYILIDVSQSMQISLDFVKQKLVALMQEQLKSKQRFNLIAFNNKVFSWRDRLVEVDEHNFNDAWKWIKTLTAQGTTNTLGAIRFALSDLNTEAIYLVTDGRPDQSPRHILSQVQLNKKVPIHTISFNCNDTEANHFLFQLARETGGRYHYFNENFWAADPDGPIPYESEDIRLLKEELEKGSKYLSQVESLRDECTKLSYLIRSNKSEKCSKDHSEKEKLPKRSPEQLEVIEQFTKLRNSRSSFADFRISNMKNRINEPDKSLLLSLSTGRSDWILPETKEFLERQIDRQSKINNEYEALTKSAPPVPAPRFKKQKPKSAKKPVENELPIKKWIKMNSLAALKLTIIDAIGPTLVKQKPAYIEILDTYVTSKVWNEIFPYTNVSSKGKNELRIVNPRKTDLEKYEENLRKQIVIYKTYLTEVIWKALSDRDPENFDKHRPTEFDAYSEHSLLKHLEKFDWPVKLEEINAIKKEIELAERYLQQSKDLRDAILSKEDVVEKEKKRMAEKSVSKGNNGKEITVGESLLARRDSNGYYFEAAVTRLIDSRHINLRFLNGEVQEHVPLLFVIRCNSTNTHSHLDLGDYVMALVLNESRERCYVPGIIQSIDSSASPKQFTVLYFNGMEGVNVRNELITINKNRYGLAANYIRTKMGLSNNLVSVRKNDTEAHQDTQTETNEFVKAGVDQLKEDIVDSLKDHLDKMKLDENYKKLMEELEKSKQKRKHEKESMKKEIKQLKKSLKEMKKRQKSKEKELEDELDGLDRETPVRPKTPVKDLRPRPPTITEELEKMRRSLADLTVGEEVLAKWTDDGWYYRSIVKEYCGNYKYKIEDTMRITEEIHREDIISESDAVENNLLELHDTVVALHPNFAFSYAPGVIIKVANNLSVVIRFYDGQQAAVSKEEVYKIPLFKFEHDVDTIIKLEKRWVGETVVAKNAFTFVYELGKIKERIGDGKQYAIEWSDGKVSVQNSIDIFGSFTKMPPIVVNDYVLAPPNEVFYLPGRVTGTRGEYFIVVFVDGTTHDNIKPENCIWLSRSYYEYAYNFYRRKFQSNTN